VILYPLHKLNPIKRIIVDTYQSVSGKDSAAIEELNSQVQQVLNGQAAVIRVFPTRLLLTYCRKWMCFWTAGDPGRTEDSGRDQKNITFPGDGGFRNLRLDAGVHRAQSGSTRRIHTSMPPEEARRILSAAPGVRLMDDTTVSIYPQPWSVAGTNECYVGRVRQDTSHRNGWQCGR